MNSRLSLLVVATLLCCGMATALRVDAAPIPVAARGARDSVRSIDCNDPDCFLPTDKLIAKWGYPVETHHVTTEDGYKLTMFRIPPKEAGAPVVYLQHGLEDCSSTWVWNTPAESLGFMAADAGFDVWLGNVRGNTYSLGHTSLSPDDKAYWAFSFDEMAKYDLPAMIDKALEVSGAEKLAYYGHSQGTRIGFQHFTSTPGIEDKVAVFGAFAPIVYLKHLNVGLIQAMADVHLGEILALFGEKRFLPHTEILEYLLPGVCHLDKMVCDVAICWFAGCDRNDWNNTRLDVYVSGDPSGTSVQNMEHYAQGVRSDTFQAYDYGRDGNQKHYGRDTPPQYDLAQMKVPTALFSGGHDTLGDPTDVARIRKELPADKFVADVTVEAYSHMDMVWGMSAHKTMYPKALSLAHEYLKKDE